MPGPTSELSATLDEGASIEFAGRSARRSTFVHHSRTSSVCAFIMLISVGGLMARWSTPCCLFGNPTAASFSPNMSATRFAEWICCSMQMNIHRLVDSSYSPNPLLRLVHEVNEAVNKLLAISGLRSAMVAENSFELFDGCFRCTMGGNTCIGLRDEFFAQGLARIRQLQHFVGVRTHRLDSFYRS
ncbi:hypothetical protein A0H81_00664 [Grifola frondosa]|uniref:Uncharacterized protein n=1 Tax=Grifola frondosa TaxID=5627 RepID=A0A1C7MPB5_GRIFR|nr:hypothetical protein A0H81_00664 [Grifola frondosa]